jgi:hypothetical protein
LRRLRAVHFTLASHAEEPGELVRCHVELLRQDLGELLGRLQFVRLDSPNRSHGATRAAGQLRLREIQCSTALPEPLTE